MSDIKDLIARQAMAVKANSNAEKIAKLHLQLAQLYQEEAGKPVVKYSFAKERSEQRVKNRERFAQANAKRVEQKHTQPLQLSGWKKDEAKAKLGLNLWVHPRMPGTSLIITEQTFCVQNTVGTVIQPKSNLANIGNFLSEFSKKYRI
ncbi:MAG TPA: hypothetical protein VK618_12510 [Flavitalea sp.]|nr:hypothetical protein [Flavitalea sp.]